MIFEISESESGQREERWGDERNQVVKQGGIHCNFHSKSTEICRRSLCVMRIFVVRGGVIH